LNSLAQLKKLRDSHSHVVIANSQGEGGGPTAPNDAAALTPVAEGTLKTLDSQDQAEVELPAIARQQQEILVEE
jgi:hypothetical protein